MPSACSVVGCNSRGHMQQRKFFRFPMLNNISPKTMAISQPRHHAWLTALSRANFFPDQYQHARICDLHFISGKSAYYTDVNNLDWIPSKNLGYEVKNQPNEEVNAESNRQCHEELNDQLNGQLNEESNDQLIGQWHEELDDESHGQWQEELNDQSNGQRYEELNEEWNDKLNDQLNSPATAFKQTQTDFSNASIGTQTDDTMTDMSSEILLSYQEKIQLLEEMLCIHNVTLDNFRGQDNKTNFFTGKSHFATVEALFEWFEIYLPISKKLTTFQIMFIVLTRLRLNLSFKYLSYQFNVSVPTVSAGIECACQ